MWYLRQRGSQSTICCVFLSQRLWTLNCVRATADTHTYTVSVVPLGPRQCDWTALFMSTIGFPLGGQTELMLRGVRVGNLRQLANQ